MGRYRSSVTSAAALASGAGFGNLVPSAAVGYLLRRITVGFTSNGAAVAASQQVGVGCSYLTAAGTGTATTIAAQRISPNGPASPTAALTTYATTFGTFPTTGGILAIPLNNQGAADLSWEEPDQMWIPPGVTGGLAFYATQVFPAGVAAVLTVEWEE